MFNYDLILNKLKIFLKNQNKKYLSLYFILVWIAYNYKISRQKKFLNKSERRKIARVNLIFLKNLIKLIKKAIPFNSIIGVRFLVLTLLLCFRTFLSIVIAKINGKIIKSFVQYNFKSYMKHILTLGLISLPASFLNSYIEYTKKYIYYEVRNKTNTYFTDKYVKDLVFYKMINIDKRIENPDQRITQDINKFSETVVNLYSNMLKPVIDIIFFGIFLVKGVGFFPLLLSGCWYIVSGWLIQIISPPIGKYRSDEQILEGNFRQGHVNLQEFSEEISLYNGSNWEKNNLNIRLEKLYKKSKQILKIRLFLGSFDLLLTKYGITLIGFGILGLPLFNQKDKNIKTSELSKHYIQNSSLLINLSKAFGRLIISYKDLQNLAAFVFLITDFERTLLDIESDNFVRSTNNNYNINENKGIIKESNNIEFHNVPIITPKGDLLIKNMGFKLDIKDNIIISGPNGCGKSSLFRILGELWPLSNGVVNRPKLKKLFYLPQKPYISYGNFLEQIIYPDLELKENTTTEDINKYLFWSELEDYKNKLYEVENWDEILSGGEKQRIAMARLFYHKPMFAILDECTSQVSTDLEAIFYNKCKEINISLLTISHRKSLFKFHNLYLKFDGYGNFKIINLQNQNDNENLYEFYNLNNENNIDSRNNENERSLTVEI